MEKYKWKRNWNWNWKIFHNLDHTGTVQGLCHICVCIHSVSALHLLWIIWGTGSLSDSWAFCSFISTTVTYMQMDSDFMWPYPWPLTVCFRRLSLIEIHACSVLSPPLYAHYTLATFHHWCWLGAKRVQYLKSCLTEVLYSICCCITTSIVARSTQDLYRSACCVGLCLPGLDPLW